MTNSDKNKTDQHNNAEGSSSKTHQGKHQPSNVPVLLFDNRQGLARFSEEVLKPGNSEGLRFSVIQAHSDKEALSVLKTNAPHIVFITLKRPKGDFFEIVKKIQKINPHIPIIAVAQADEKNLALQAVKQGVQDTVFITDHESLNANDVIPKIQYAIERRRISEHIDFVHHHQIAGIIDSVSDGVILIDPDKTVLYANRAAENILQLPLNKLIGSKFKLPYSIDGKISHVLRCADRSTRYLEIITKQVPWIESDHCLCCVTLRDITEHKRLQEELISAANLKNEFIAHISHELRTPMNGVIGMTSILLESNVSPETKKQLEVIRNSGKVMLRIINDLLDITKIEANKLQLNPGYFDFVSFLFDTVQLFRGKADERHVELKLKNRVPDNLEIFADQARLQQILTNLVSNALKYTNEGFVEVRSRLNEVDGKMFLILSIKDTGIGIERADLPKLFVPFSQIQNSQATQSEGTGLGLAITKRLVKLMNGQIRCQSVKGLGTTFSVRIPVRTRKLDVRKTSPRDIQMALAEEEEKSRVARKQLSYALQQIQKALIVEDNLVNQKVLGAMLKQLQVDYDVVENGEQAIQVCCRSHYDLIFMDCKMPVMNGYEATKRIRDLSSHYAKIPIIAITAHAMETEKSKCLASGMTDYLAKPVTLKTIELALVKHFACDQDNSEIMMRADDKHEKVIIDWSVLEELGNLSLKTGSQVLREVLEIFVKQCEDFIEELSEAFNNDSSEKISQVAHKIAGSARNIGALNLTDLAEQLEETADKNTGVIDGSLLDELKQAYALTIGELRKKYLFLNDINFDIGSGPDKTQPLPTPNV